MPGFTSYDDMINEATTNGKIQIFDFMKNGGTTQGAGFWYSLARVGAIPVAITDGATTPGTARTNATGTLNGANVSTDQKTIVTFGAVSTVACGLMLYDRLVDVSAISLATTGSKTINSAALPRYTGASAVGVQCWLEVTTATTVTAPVVHLLTYTDEGGTTANVGASNTTFPAAATVLNTMVGPLAMAAGDAGIRSVETLNCDTAGTAGIVQVVLLKPLAYLNLPANTWVEKDFVLQLTSMPRMFDGASLCLMQYCSATTATNIQGRVQVIYG